MQDLRVPSTVIKAQIAAQSWKLKDGVKDLLFPQIFPLVALSFRCRQLTMLRNCIALLEPWVRPRRPTCQNCHCLDSWQLLLPKKPPSPLTLPLRHHIFRGWAPREGGQRMGHGTPSPDPPILDRSNVT